MSAPRFFVRAPGFETRAELFAWFEGQGAVEARYERGPDRHYRGVALLPIEQPASDEQRPRTGE